MYDDAVFAKFWSRVDKRGPEYCWPWQGTRQLKGYGIFNLATKKYLATHVSLSADGRDKPDGMFALHSCDNPWCVNPAHLRWGTAKENSADASARVRHHKQKNTHCADGHPFSGDNLYLKPNGHRMCLICLREKQKAYKTAKRQDRRGERSRALADARAKIKQDHANYLASVEARRSSNPGAVIGKYGFRGVYYAKTRNRYKAQIGSSRQGTQKRGPWRIYPEDAARDYDILAEEMYGDAAQKNFPNPLVTELSHEQRP